MKFRIGRLFAFAALIILARLPSSAEAAAPDANAQREAQAALSALRQLRSQCDNTAWSLSYSNDYKKWRAHESSVSMNYSYSIPKDPPTAPASMPEALRARFNPLAAEVVETVTAAGAAFRDFTTYMNAKDYEDDGFKKGDALNAQLLEAGETCHRLTKDVERLHADYADLQLVAYAEDPAKAERARQLRQDMAAVQALALEMSKGKETDRAAIEKSVADISERVEARKASLAAVPAAEAGALKRFYLQDMETDVAVEMRKMLRETKGKPKEWNERLADRPRSAMMRLRDAAFIQMPDDALSMLK